METTTSAAHAGTVTIGGDLTVNRLGFGAMRLCGPGVWGPPADNENALAVLRRAAELGVNFIDTAEAYGPEINEVQIAQALHPYPAGLVIATKGGTTRSGPNQWGRDCRPERLKALCDGSLRRLRVERIDLYQLHAVDTQVPLEEQVGALRDLRDAGKVRHIGLSNVTVAQVQAAERIVPIASVQNSYNAGLRTSEDVLDYCERRNIVFIPYFPIAAGDVEDLAHLQDVATRRGATIPQIALAWLLKRSPVMLPIPGTSSVKHLEENLGAASIQLNDDEFEEIAG